MAGPGQVSKVVGSNPATGAQKATNGVFQQHTLYYAAGASGGHVGVELQTDGSAGQNQPGSQRR